jgi:hypothetical protein
MGDRHDTGQSPRQQGAAEDNEAAESGETLHTVTGKKEKGESGHHHGLSPRQTERPGPCLIIMFFRISIMYSYQYHDFLSLFRVILYIY